MDNPYLEVISHVERLHRQFLEVVKLELEGFGIRDINNIQAMMLFNIGDAEMTVGRLIGRFDLAVRRSDGGPNSQRRGAQRQPAGYQGGCQGLPMVDSLHNENRYEDVWLVSLSG